MLSCACGCGGETSHECARRKGGREGEEREAKVGKASNGGKASLTTLLTGRVHEYVLPAVCAAASGGFGLGEKLILLA